MRNPHSPTKEWLDGVATDQNGYAVDAQAGDENSMIVTRDGVEYEVTVSCLGESEQDNDRPDD